MSKMSVEPVTPTKHDDDTAWLRRMVQFEQSATNKIAVPAQLAREHSLIRLTIATWQKDKISDDDRDRLLAMRMWAKRMVVLPLHVSFKSRPRVLRLCNALLWAVEKRGATVELVPNRLRIEINGGYADLRFSELTRGTAAPTMTGQICVAIDGPNAAPQRLADYGDRPLEDRLNDVLCLVYRIALRTKTRGDHGKRGGAKQRK